MLKCSGYILKSESTGKLYIGQTANLEERLQRHNNNKVDKSRYTHKQKGPWKLIPDATLRKFRIVQKEGQRNVTRMVDYYNLDTIISVGYRVKSHVATRFRIWATQRLREYIVKRKNGKMGPNLLLTHYSQLPIS